MSSNNEKRSAACEWCKEQPGDYNMSPPDRGICNTDMLSMFCENFGEICEGLR